MANPYSSYVEGEDIRLLIEEFPEKLRAVVGQLGEDGLQRSLAPGKWTAGQILCHLADCEVAWAFRWRQALAEDHHLVQPFDQDKWSAHYKATDPHEALETFLALRRWNISLLGLLSSSEWQRPVNHPEQGELTFRSLVEITAGHDRHHLKQFNRILAHDQA